MTDNRWTRILWFALALGVGLGLVLRTGYGAWILYFLGLVPAGFATRELLAKIKAAAPGRRWFPVVELTAVWVTTLVALVSAAQTDRKLATLEDQQRGRVLSSQDLSGLRDDLARLPKAKVVLMGIDGNRESVGLAKQLKPVLLEVGWTVDGVWEDSIVGGAGEGILVRQNALATNFPGPQLVHTFNKRNLHARLINLPDPDLTRFEIVVGARPE